MESVNIHKFLESEKFSNCIKIQLFALCITNKIIMSVVLSYVISCNQSAFLPADNILAAYETLHTMHTCMWSKVGFMGIKLDMSKVYDRVKWLFLEAVTEKMGFEPGWIGLI